MLIVFLCTILLILGNNVSFADDTIIAQTPTSDFYVNDFANIFTEEQKQEMISRAVELNDTYNGIQVVVSTVETLQGNKIEEYAHSMYNQYDIGKNSMGILILLSTTDKDVKIEIGEKLQKNINGSVSEKIHSKLLTSYLKTEDLAQGTVIAQSEIINEIKENISADWEKIDKNNANGMFIFFIVIFGLGICCIIYCLYGEKSYY